MKKWILGISLIALTTCGLPGQSSKTERSEVIKKEIEIGSEGLLHIRNINGGLNLEGYDGTKIILEVNKTIKAKSESQLEKGWQEAELGVLQKGNAVLLYQKTPCSNENLALLEPEDWDDWNMMYKDNCNWKTGYDFKLDFKIKLPRGLNLDISTVNNGDIIVKNNAGTLDVNNVNGAITLEQVSGTSNVRTVNGDVTLTYVKMPAGDCKFYTLNGDINALFPKGGSSNMYFESYNGDFYTDIDDASMEPLPLKVEKARESKGVTYKVGGKAGIKVRNGGPKLEFETFNGDVYIKEQ